MALSWNSEALLNYVQSGRFFWSIIMAGITTLFAAYIRWCMLRRNFSQLVPCRQPRFFSPFGNLGDNFKRPQGYRYPFGTYVLQEVEGYSKLFKNSQLFCYWAYFRPLVIIRTPEAAEKVLKSSLRKAWNFKWLHPIIGDGLLSSSGCKWKSRRKLLNPCFHYNALRNFMPVMDEQSRVLVKCLRQETDKEFTNISTLLSLCSLDIVCETILGVRMSAQVNHKNAEVLQSLNRGYLLVMRRIKKLYLWPDITYSFSKDGKDMKEQVEIWKDFTDEILRKKKGEYLSGEVTMDEGRRKSLMDLLLEHHLQTKEFSEDDIRDELYTFTIAGSDTTANSLSWILYLLGLYPDIQAKVHEELDSIFGEDVDSIASEHDLSCMKYLERVIKESQRIYPAITALLRHATEDLDVGGYKILKGAVCLVVTYLLHHDEELFPNPEIFDPDRFLPENSSNRHPYSYMPFSAGPRNCIGLKFAMIEMKIILSNIFRNYAIESLDPRDKLLPGLSVFLKPSIPVRLKIRFRRPAST